MTKQEILDSIYLMPVLLDHFDHPNDNTRTILQGFGVEDSMIQELHSIKHLLEYHRFAVQNNYKENYTLLRQGLDEYFKVYLADIFKRLGITDKTLLMLDYGCGNGQYSDQFLIDNPNSQVVSIDKQFTEWEKHPCKKIQQVDFEHDPAWYKGYTEQFDLVLLSEVLHCKAKSMQQYLIDSSFKMLKPGGCLIINENQDHCMEYRITKIKQHYRPLVGFPRIKELTEFYPFLMVNLETINQHYFYVYKKNTK